MSADIVIDKDQGTYPYNYGWLAARVEMYLDGSCTRDQLADALARCEARLHPDAQDGAR